MDKVERYRQVFLSFKELCSTGRQPSSFSAYCKANSVDQCQMRQTLKNEFQNIRLCPDTEASVISVRLSMRILNRNVQMADSRARLLIFIEVMALHGSRCTAILSGINLRW